MALPGGWKMQYNPASNVIRCPDTFNSVDSFEAAGADLAGGAFVSLTGAHLAPEELWPTGQRRACR
jgi:hypothetical protein